MKQKYLKNPKKNNIMNIFLTELTKQKNNIYKTKHHFNKKKKKKKIK